MQADATSVIAEMNDSIHGSDIVALTAGTAQRPASCQRPATPAVVLLSTFNTACKRKDGW
jgi:hypothetical protein